ncbi:MAG: hypothetical protein ABFS10_13520 [Bacteroidota bacterium]
MKAIGTILMVGILFLGLNRFEAPGPFGLLQEDAVSAAACCCDSHNDCHGEQGEDEAACQDHEEGDKEHACPMGCDCDCSCHSPVVAIEYHIPVSFRIDSQNRDYGTYTNRYLYEYHTPHFQPPRFSELIS